MSGRRPTLHEHQQQALERVVQVIDRYGGALLADEVGLGKSFVAAELIARRVGEGKSAVLVVPAVLRPMWTTIAARFGIAVPIFSHDSIANLPLAPGAWRSALLVVDEAHHFRHREIDRSRALARLSVGTEMLLLTATPVNNRVSDLFALIELFAADDAFKHLGCRSIEEALRNDDRLTLRSIVDVVAVRRDATAARLVRSLPRVVRRTVRYAAHDSFASILLLLAALRFPAVRPDVSRELLNGVLARRLSSSTSALRDTLLRMQRFNFRAIDAGQQGLRLSRREFDRIFGAKEVDAPFQDLLFGELWGMAKQERIDIAAFREEVARIDALVGALEGSTDTKEAAFLDAFPKLEKPCLIFTSAVATAIRLGLLLRPELQCGVVTGNRCLDPRGRRSSAESLCGMFQSGEIDVLVATDRVSEGVNLQRAATIIHYDLPWNPVRIEQRNGRARRLGSTREWVTIVYLLPRDAASRKVLTTLAKKRRAARAMLGDVRLDQPPGGFFRTSGSAEGVAALFGGELASCVGDALVSPRYFLQHVRTVARPGGDAERGRLARLVRALETVSRLPPVVGPRSPHVRLALNLRGGGLLDSELARLLTLRFRRGVEEQLSELAAGSVVDRALAETVRELLAPEVRASPPFADPSFVLLLERQRTD